MVNLSPPVEQILLVVFRSLLYIVIPWALGWTKLLPTSMENLNDTTPGLLGQGPRPQ